LQQYNNTFQLFKKIQVNEKISISWVEGFKNTAVVCRRWFYEENNDMDFLIRFLSGDLFKKFLHLTTS